MPTPNQAQIEATEIANAHLTNAGLPSYSDLINLLHQAQYLGLRFDIGSAYIRRSYINEQDEINRKINAVPC